MRVAGGVLRANGRLRGRAVALAVALAAAAPSWAWAQTLPDALVRTYQGNPQLNAERARLRGVDETVPQALAGYRPQIMAVLTGGLQQVRVLFFDNTIQTATLNTWTIGLTVSQTLFNGFKTANTVRQSEAQVQSGREALRNTGQGVLLDAVIAYTNVIANQSLVEAQRINVTFLRQTLDTTRKRYDAGDVTPTDVAQLGTKIAEASLWPNLSVQGSVQRQWENDPTLSAKRLDNASIIGQANVPIYDGGLAASQIRQAKEIAMQARIVLELVRNQTQTAVIGAWVSHEGAKIALAAAESEVRAAQVALEGVQKEAQGGQRTTLDVLNSQQDLTAARARLIGAQRDRVIASYTLLAATGRLDVKTLGLRTPDYEPAVHYHQVRDAWGGLRTPSGQ